MLYNKSRSPYRRAALLPLVLLAISAAWAGSKWADAPADLTIGEHLELQFKLELERHDSEELNSFTLVGFYPSSDPQKALVFVTQTWRDERLQPQDLRREIRKIGEVLTKQFEAMARHPHVRKRWKIENPKANIVVRHARYSDLRETLAVTLNGETIFDENDILKAKAEVTARGAIWSW